MIPILNSQDFVLKLSKLFFQDFLELLVIITVFKDRKDISGPLPFELVRCEYDMPEEMNSETCW